MKIEIPDYLIIFAYKFLSKESDKHLPLQNMYLEELKNIFKEDAERIMKDVVKQTERKIEEAEIMSHRNYASVFLFDELEEKRNAD